MKSPRPAGAVPVRLSRRLRPLFWDHDFARLTWEADSDLIVGRILAAGDWEAVLWLRRLLPKLALRDWLERRNGAGLSARQLRFWELILGLPRRQVNTWLSSPRAPGMGGTAPRMTWHPEILTRQQQRVLAQLGPLLTRHGFYLAGGTAVALHLGHRRSVDLDWFTAEGLPDPLRLAQDLREWGVAFVTGQVAQGTLHGSVRGVRLSLLEYRYPLLAALRPWPRGGSRIAARADLAAMKLAAVAQRGAKKDFLDVYALGSRCCSLRQMLRWYQEKYAVQDLAHVLYSLAYFDDADRERMPRLLWDVNWRTMKETIRRWLREVTR